MFFYRLEIENKRDDEIDLRLRARSFWGLYEVSIAHLHNRR